MEIVIDPWTSEVFKLLTKEQYAYVYIHIHKSCAAMVKAKENNLTPEQFINQYFKED